MMMIIIIIVMMMIGMEAAVAANVLCRNNTYR